MWCKLPGLGIIRVCGKDRWISSKHYERNVHFMQHASRMLYQSCGESGSSEVERRTSFRENLVRAKPNKAKI